MAFLENVLKTSPGTLVGGLILIGFVVRQGYSETVLTEVTKNGATEQFAANEVIQEGSIAQSSSKDNVHEAVVEINYAQKNDDISQLNQTDPEGSQSQDGNTTVATPNVSSNKTSGVRHKKVTCFPRNETNTNLTVQVMDTMWSVSLQDTSPNSSNNGLCFAVLFYTPSCHFCAAAAPHYNALPRVFPDVLCLAIDASTYSSLNTRLGIIGLPTLMLFHGGQPVAKFNDSQYTLDRFVVFISKYTGLNPVETPNVTSADFEGPLSSTALVEWDPLLWLAWMFVISCCLFGITKSTLFNRIIEALRNNWHEAEAQHQHVD